MASGWRLVHVCLFYILFNFSPTPFSDSEGAQRTARRELAAAKLHRRHPHEHHRAAPGASGGAKVRRRGRNAPNWTFSMIAKRRASRRESDETMTETKKQTDWEEVTVWYRSAIHHHHYRCCTRARTPHTWRHELWYEEIQWFAKPKVGSDLSCAGAT